MSPGFFEHVREQRRIVDRQASDHHAGRPGIEHSSNLIARAETACNLQCKQVTRCQRREQFMLPRSAVTCAIEIDDVRLDRAPLGKRSKRCRGISRVTRLAGEIPL